jgi:DNA-nicking Smr family endonuclease
MGRKPIRVPLSQRPFSEIAGQSDTAAGRDPATASAEAGIPDASEDDEALFLQATVGVVPLPAGPQPPLMISDDSPARGRLPDPEADDDAVRTELQALVRGEIRFTLADTQDFIEGAVADLDRRTRLRLRRGDFAVQGHLDLHGLNSEDAHEALKGFIRHGQLSGKRCLLVIHGKGRNSRDGEPVLKLQMSRWLSRGAIGREVLAFCTAQPADGGGGALYVLLRRSSGRTGG